MYWFYTFAWQVSVSTPSKTLPWCTSLSEDDSKVGRALAGGHLPSVAKAIVGHKQLNELVFELFIDQIYVECKTLCQRSAVPPSLFRRIPVSRLSDFVWKACIDELSSKAPHFLQILTRIVSHSDHRNKKKVTSAHYPSISMAASVILNERNREMCGIQSLVPLLLFASRVQKQVKVIVHFWV